MSTAQLVPALNGTLINGRECTVDICSLDYAQVQYVPSLTANAIFMAIFIILLLLHSFQMYKYRLWSFSGAVLGGLVLEIAGYGGRLGLHMNPFNFDSFVAYLVCVTIGPAFFAAAIYLCLSRLIVAYGAQHARLHPRTYTITFIGCDFLSLLLQAVGGALAATGKTADRKNMGVNTMIAGLVIQVISLLIYIVLSLDFYRSIHRVPENARNPDFAALRRSKLFHRLFPFALAAAVTFIFVRCVFRVAELSEGFRGHLANDEKTYNALEAPMIILAVSLLAAFHPGRCFEGMWHSANWTVRGGRGTPQASKGRRAADLEDSTASSSRDGEYAFSKL